MLLSCKLLPPLLSPTNLSLVSSAFCCFNLVNFEPDGQPRELLTLGFLLFLLDEMAETIVRYCIYLIQELLTEKYVGV